MTVRASGMLDRFTIPEPVRSMLESAPNVVIPPDRQTIFEMAMGGQPERFDVSYEVPGKGLVKEAEVVKCKNGLAINYTEAYMRRRDPDCMLVADDDPSDKTKFSERFDFPFSGLRQEVFDWLATQDLMILPFLAGGSELGYDALLIAPANAAFFVGGLADLQGMIPSAEIPEDFHPRAFIYLAPPFRHTHCDGKQVVVHNREEGIHEIYSLNLYPGPSAKKGVYGILLTIGESEGWLTAHGSSVQVVTPYDNVVTIMHEGASGGGKSEMLEHVHREADGRLLLGKNVVSGERRHVTMTQTCVLHPVTDDMALCHPEYQQKKTRLVVTDAEGAWFLRINHIDHYGTDPDYERITIHPSEPILFLNIEGTPGATCLIWEHTQDEPGKPCPNPRVILPRRLIPNVVNEPVEVNVRSFGIRTPPCTKEKPSYGIFGLLHYLPPALAWLWRLVAPRGFSNPSITDTAGMTSEGVGSYWPFATGRRVDQANLLLNQMLRTPDTRYTLSPNQHVGAWNTGFMPQWLAREYMARRGGARFRPEHLLPARCPLGGYTLASMQIEGTQISHWFLQVETQPEVGLEGYDKGAEELTAFFKRELTPYYKMSDLKPLGRKIVECCLQDGTLDDYVELIRND